MAGRVLDLYIEANMCYPVLSILSHLCDLYMYIHIVYLNSTLLIHFWGVIILSYADSKRAHVRPALAFHQLMFHQRHGIRTPKMLN